MTDDAPSPREGLSDHLRQLEEFVERAETDGSDVPVEAAEMIARLREIILALDGLTASMDGGAAAPPE
ncbi:MAG: hypothetical protein ABIY52_18485 [Gemmatimonadaceae bacterium]